MQIPILNGIYTDSGAPDFRTSYPRNLVPVPKDQGISKGYLRPAEGLRQFGGSGPGSDRGGINWNRAMYRVMGTKLVSVSSAGVIQELGTVGGAEQVAMDVGFDRVGIASNGSLFYWDGIALSQNTSPNLRTVLTVKFVGGYWVTTDGLYIVVTNLNDPFTVDPLKYGSLDADPGPLKAIDELRNELYAFGRYVIGIFQNVGGVGFPFQQVQGALVPRGIIGTHAYCDLGDSFAFVGSGRKEAPGVYRTIPADTEKLSTREIDQVLLGYSEEVLSLVVMESRVDKHQQLIYIHLPDQTLVYDTMASGALGEPVWHTLTTSVVGLGQYLARNLVWCYDRWIGGDPSAARLCELVDDVSSHYEGVNGWEFGTQALYNEGNPAILHELELVALPGRVALGDDPVVWASYSTDGQTWSAERPAKAGKQGERNKRIAWRNNGRVQHWRTQRFRGTSEAHLSFARLEAKVEPLFTRPGRA